MAEPFLTITGTDALVRRLLEIGADAPRAATRALNRTLTTLKARTVRGIAQDLGVSNKFVDRSITAQRATFSRQIATLTIGPYRREDGRIPDKGKSGTLGRIPLVAFGARQTRKGVSYRLPSGRGLLPHGFLATMRSGHRGVFQRAGRGRLPIVEQYGPSPTRVFRQHVMDAALREADAVLEKNLAHEIDWIIRQRVAAGDEAA